MIELGVWLIKSSKPFFFLLRQHFLVICTISLVYLSRVSHRSPLFAVFHEATKDSLLGKTRNLWKKRQDWAWDHSLSASPLLYARRNADAHIGCNSDLPGKDTNFLNYSVTVVTTPWLIKFFIYFTDFIQWGNHFQADNARYFLPHLCISEILQDNPVRLFYINRAKWQGKEWDDY